MSKIDYQEEFIRQLNNKAPRKADLIDEIADLLFIERDAAYRRLAGKVDFKFGEACIVANKYNLSVDQVIHKSADIFWLPFFMEHPMQARSIENMYDMIVRRIERVGEVTKGDNSESGNIVNSLPMEFFMLSPLLSRFMFFKWGNFCVATEEFDRFSEWELPAKFEELPQKMRDVYTFENIYYIWDESIIWNLCRDISNFHRIGVLSAGETKELAFELKSMLGMIENAFEHDENPVLPGSPPIDFYVSPFTLGFVSHYYQSSEACSVMFETNYTFSEVEGCRDSCSKLKHWMDSFLEMSVRLSGTGRNDRAIFFNNQNQIIDRILKLPSPPL